MSKLVSSVESLEFNIKKLISKYDRLKVEHQQLRDQFDSKSESISELNTEIERLQQENKTLRTANAMLGSTEHKRETKLKINSLIKEIDDCIIQLAE
jgi:chromosome segregation ATPase